MANIITADEMLAYAEAMCNLWRDIAASKSYYDAEEQETEDRRQDLIHSIELNPKEFDPNFLIQQIHQLGEDRRRAKDNQSIVNIISPWIEKNKAALNALDQVVGKMRKVRDAQPNRVYMVKTKVFGDEKQGTWITTPPDERSEYEVAFDAFVETCSE